ncbi:uncharacterized protein LOC121375728 isoform X2 [Gigantopelta aegis]|uniref:uncharacterized protein LOC121375728 isoform X2 n=1 Tax=Gigantopelta aegis TaxID=1735272 RepID=UPI001B88B491|nr:uncharacterized protein LOC121375728 isoform X2 [Gigantopelta aegis]
MSLADQLRKVQLKSPKEPMKDFSSPRVSGGFVSDTEIAEYQNSVLDVNTELWLDLLADVTFPTEYCAIERHEAKLFISVFERLYRNLDPSGISQVEWREHLSPDEHEIVKSMTDRLSKTMHKFTSDGGSAFVKTSSRSPKDAPLAQTRFKEMYVSHLAEADDSQTTSENTKITCLLQAAFEALRVKSADEVLDMMFRSERIYQDMLLAVQIEDRFCENFVIRQFVPIDVDMEFRGFVYGKQLVALSQYNYLIHSKRLVEKRSQISDLIRDFFNTQVTSRLKSHKTFPDNFVIDFAVCDEDGALFSWEHERRLLEGEEGFVFRLVEREKPGATAMLPLGIKALLQS